MDRIIPAQRMAPREESGALDNASRDLDDAIQVLPLSREARLCPLRVGRGDLPSADLSVERLYHLNLRESNRIQCVAGRGIGGSVRFKTQTVPRSAA